MSVHALNHFHTQAKAGALDDFAPPTRFIYSLLAFHANRAGRSWPGLALLMRLSGYSRSAVYEAFQELQRAGRIARNGRVGHATRWLLALPPLPEDGADGAGAEVHQEDAESPPPGRPKEEPTSRNRPITPPGAPGAGGNCKPPAARAAGGNGAAAAAAAPPATGESAVPGAEVQQFLAVVKSWPNWPAEPVLAARVEAKTRDEWWPRAAREAGGAGRLLREFLRQLPILNTTKKRPGARTWLLGNKEDPAPRWKKFKPAPPKTQAAGPEAAESGDDLWHFYREKFRHHCARANTAPHHAILSWQEAGGLLFWRHKPQERDLILPRLQAWVKAGCPR